MSARRLPEFSHGSVWLVGAGPGDPGLLTRLAAHAMEMADHIVYDALVSDGVLAMAGDGATLHYAGKRGGKPSVGQPDISAQIIELANSGARVCRLKGGDPLVFGRGGEEALALEAAGIPFRIVPGITAGVGGLAYAGIPPTHRDINAAVTFLTGHDASGETPHDLDWSALSRGAPVLVIYMAMKHLEEICGHLVEAGRSPGEPVALISDATLPTQKVVRTSLGAAIHDAKTQEILPPVMVVIGEVVNFQDRLAWFDPTIAP